MQDEGMTCCVHYSLYTNEKILPLGEDHHARLLEAKNARFNLGGDNVHPEQGAGIPPVFPSDSNLSFHQNCYKKYTKAISVWNKRKNETGESSASSSSSRLQRTGDVGGVLFPKYCMICKSDKVIKVKGKKRQVPKVLRELKAEASIREAAKLHQDNAMIAAIMPETLSLRSAEFKVHDKCRQDYTRICPPKTKRARMDKAPMDSPEELVIGGATGADVGSGGRLLRVRRDCPEVEQVDKENSGMDIEEIATTGNSSVEGIDVDAENGSNDDDDKDDDFVPPSYPQSRNEEEDMDSYTAGDSERLFDYVREHIILVGQAISMKVLTNVYGFDGSDRKHRYYVKKLLLHEFADEILVLNDPYKKKPQIIVRAKAYDDGELLHESNKNCILRHAAQFLRNDIDEFVAKEKDEEEVWPPTVESLNKTRGRYPECLQYFFNALLKNRSHAAGENVVLAVGSMIDDVVHSVSNGNILTLKHTLMGCGMHSISGSRLDIDIMYKMNNCCSYDRVRAIETAQAELAIELSKRQFPLPLIPKDEYSRVLLRLWFDNFDVNKENKEGSIHTCHGVAYTESSSQTLERTSEIQMPKSSRRSLGKDVVELPNANIDKHKLPPLLNDAKDFDYDRSYASFLPLLWKTQRQICSSAQSVSYRYVGWISTIFKATDQKRTNITFLPPINNPITEFSTVIECIYQSEKLAEACNMKYIHITADVGAACKFYQVQWNNPERFKNVIIHLGDFHAMQELFGIIGKIITGSGFEDVLYQADLCTSGGIKGILSGKHYNRCWKFHECLAESLHRLLIERELESLTVSKDLENLIKSIGDAKSCQDLFENPEFKNYYHEFNSIENQYLNGDKGKTPQFWTLYTSLVQLVQELHYSINVNDFYLRLKCWKDIVFLCAATNKRNYLRYGSYYIETMQNLPNTHPGAVEELLEKGISVRRNDIGIGQSIDGAGEQTFMRSSKTRGGIKSFTSNIATYNKWVLSRPFQAKFVEALLEMIGKNEAGSHTKALRKSEIEKSELRIKKMSDILTNTFINPFSLDLEESKLFNIASGCPISDEAATILLNIKKKGEELHQDFQEKISGNHSENFWTPITTVEWKDFTSSNRTAKAKTSKGKTIEVKVQRDILGFLLAKSQELSATIQMEECLKYPLCAVELSIAHGDGRKRKTNKSALLPYIPPPETTSSSNIEAEKVYILDLAAIVRSTVKVPDTFEELAIQIWKEISEKYKYIYVACDTYFPVSIKSFERKERGESNKFLIRSGKVRIPPDFQKFLCNGENKERLFELIESIWISQGSNLGDRVVYFARKNSCVKITQYASTLIPELSTNHEEADTKVAYLAQHAIDTYSPIEIVIRSRSGDVDIPVILTAAFGSTSTPIVVDNGTGKHRKNIRVDSSALSDVQCRALVGFHAFTGNDYVSSFLRRTKKVWEKVREDDESLSFFDLLGVAPLDDDLFSAGEKFVCMMYGDRKCGSVNLLRNKIFWKHYRKNGKIIDLSLLPPCSSSLRKHTSRAYYVAKVWKNACIPFQDIDSFTNYCWYPDGSIDWIDIPYPSDVADLYGENDCPQDHSCDDLEEDDGLDNSDVDDEEQD